MKRKQGPSVVNHKNITRVTDVYASVLPGFDIGSVVSGIEARLGGSQELRPSERQSDRGPYFAVHGPEFEGKGYTYTLSGEVATMREMLAQFAQGLVLALILIYLVMVVQFRSFIDPLVVLLSVPLGMVGVAGLLYTTGTALSIMAAMGIIMMVGLVVSYGILLVDFANRRMTEGAPKSEAVRDAVQVRLRPILMTSLAAVFALLPMAIGGPGAEANAPLARAMIGGVLSAATLSLLVVPCLYVVFKRRKLPVVATAPMKD
jgi:multidrug efflux pump subunit AcrB